MNGPNNVLITGGGGFIAPHLIAALPSDWNVTVHVRSASRLGDLVSSPRVKVITGVLNTPDLYEAMKHDVSTVFHLAGAVSGPDIGEVIDSNLVTTANVLSAMERANVPTLVFMSTASVWSDSSGQPLNESMPANPSTVYGYAKLAAERLINDAVLRGALQRGVALRCNNTYGPGSLQGAVHAFIERVKAGRNVQIYGDGQQMRQPIYVSDVVDLLLRSMDARPGMNVYGVGGPRAITILDMAETIAAALGKDCQVDWLEENSDRVRHIAIDTSKARADLGWVPMVDFVAGVAKTADVA